MLWVWKAVTMPMGSTPARAPALARFSATLAGSSPEPKPQLSEAKIPSLTPPWRPQKAWRTWSIWARGAGWLKGGVSSGDVGESRGWGEVWRRQRQGLEQGAHFPRVEQAPSRRIDVAGLGRGRPCPQALGAGLEAEAEQELALGQRAMGDGAGLLGGLREAGEIHMGRKIRLADLAQRID